MAWVGTTVVSAMWFLIKQAAQDSKKGEQKCIRPPEGKFRTDTGSHPLNSIGLSRSHGQPRLKGWGNGLHFWWGEPHSLASNVATGKGASLWQVFAIHLSKAYKELNKAQGSKEINPPIFGWVFFYHLCLRFLFTNYKYRFSFFLISLGQTPENINGKGWLWFLFCSRLHVSLHQLILPEESH